MNSTKTLAIALGSTFLLLTGCQSTPSINSSATNSNATMLTQGLEKVDENYAAITVNKEVYVLDTYIIPFQQPYYILVRKQDGKRFSNNIADVLAVSYIKTRGCTETLVRREDLDKSSSDSTQHLIGVAC